MCDRYTSIVRDRDRFTMGREERVVGMVRDRVSFGTWRCTYSRSKAILVSAKEAFICAVTLFFLCTKTFLSEVSVQTILI